MAPEIGQEGNATVVNIWETGLAERAVSSLTEAHSYASHQDLADKLTARLLQEKSDRLNSGLNHWEEHVATVADRLLKEVLAEAKHKAELAAFVQETREEALVFVRAFLVREEDAEDAVAESFARLAAGRTKPANFFRTLKHVAVDMYRRQEQGRKVVEPLGAQGGDGVGPADTGRESSRKDLQAAANLERATRALEGTDPLEAVLRESMIEEAIQIVLTDRRKRGIRSRQWWKDLMKTRGLQPEVSRKRSAQTND